MVKPLKDVDTASKALFLKNFLRIFPLLAILGLVLGGTVGLLVALVVSVVATVVSESFAGLIGASASSIYGVGRRSLSVRERLSSKISIARHSKMNKRFDQALLYLEEALVEDPNFPEALYLKAQILWEGFGESEEAKECLKKIIATETNPNDTTRRWAMNLYRELSNGI